MIGVWVVAIVLAFGVIGIFLEDALSSEARVTGNPESAQAEQLLAERFPAAEVAGQRDVTEVVVVRGSSPDRAQTIADELRAAGASHVVTPSEDDRLVSEDGDAFALLVGLGEPPEDQVAPVVAVVERLDAQPGVEAGISGEWTLDADFQQLSQDDLRTGELYFGIPAALVILLLVFGAVVAGLVPLVFALVSIFVALGLTALVGQAFELSVFVVNMLTGMGLALGIDYTLFILSRYREERVQGREKPDAIATAGATASRAVLFSGLAFVLAMTGMLLVPSSIMRSLAAGAILVGIVSVIAALTLLPAVLSLVGDRVNALSLLRARSRDPGGRESLLGPNRRFRHAPPRRQPRCRGSAPARGGGPGLLAGDGLVRGVDPPRPLRVKTRIPTPEPGVPRPVDRPRADRRGRQCVLTSRTARDRPPRGGARRTALVRRADRRDE
jgi:RND superfamily putative drug exporter